MNDFRILLLSLAHHGVHTSNHSAELLLELDHLDDTLLKDIWEVQKSEGVTRRSSIKNNQLKIISVQILQDLTERCCFVNTGYAAHDLGHEAFALLLHLLGHTLHGLTALSTKHGTHTSKASSILVLSGVNLDGEEILESIDLCGFAIELLIKRITEVMGWIG